MKGTFIYHSEPAEHRSYFLTHTCLTFLFLLLFALPETASAGVSAKYTKSKGTELAISISVTSPTPSSLILVHKLPPGVRLLNTEPPANNINAKNGVAKWLIRERKPGMHTIRLYLDKEVAAKDISATIRYKPASGGGTKTQPVNKP